MTSPTTHILSIILIITLCLILIITYAFWSISQSSISASLTYAYIANRYYFLSFVLFMFQ